MDKVIIFGTSVFSAVLYQTIVQEGQAEVVAFTVDRDYVNGNSFESIPLIPFEDLNKHFDMDDVSIAIALGYKQMNDIRENIYKRCSIKGYKIYSFISNKASVYTQSIGEGSIILPDVFVGPYVNVGKSVILWNKTALCHHITVGDYTFISGGVIIGGESIIGKHCFIGLNSTIINGITVGDRTFVGAASYMNHSTLENGLGFRGNPASTYKGMNSDQMIELVN